MIVFDENKQKIISLGGFAKQKKDPKICKRASVSYDMLSYKKNKYILIYLVYTHPYDILFLDFIEGLFNAMISYGDTMKSLYYRDPIDISITDELYIINIEQEKIPQKIDKDIFETYTSFFLEQLSHNKMRGYIAEIAIMTKSYITQEMHKKYIASLCFDEVNEIFSSLAKMK